MSSFRRMSNRKYRRLRKKRMRKNRYMKEAWDDPIYQAMVDYFYPIPPKRQTC